MSDEIVWQIRDREWHIEDCRVQMRELGQERGELIRQLVTETGSIRAAAKALEVDRKSIRRKLDALEKLG